ncbi:hypothetical protein [Halorussus litoreus]|uniref:hypothetical protein n=1 Tax=Halorussus litoreus TaxID=1710536 RepID=UPI000E21C409|nr:hypothetical protein [Halorussus litoreus]
MTDSADPAGDSADALAAPSTAADALDAGETVRERLPLRTGGSVVLTGDRLLVQSDDGSGGDAVTAVDFDQIAEVTVEQFDWFLGVLSALLVGYGLYSIPRSLPLGLAFAAFGAASLYWSYRKRGKARIKVLDRPKPISVFPADIGAFRDALEPAMATGSDDSSGENSD